MKHLLSPSKSYKALEWLLIGLIVTIGAYFRLYDLHRLPLGLHHDEAAYALDALEIVQTGKLPIFLESNYGRETLFVWIVAPFFWLLGASPYTIRLVAALFGTITIVPVYFLAKALFSAKGQGPSLVGLLAAFLTAVLYWHVNFSRSGLRAVTLPLFEVATVYFFWLGMKQSFRWAYILGGAFLGGCLYTYTSGRLYLIAVGFLFIITAFRKTPQRKEHLLNWLMAGLVFLMVSSPLAIYFARQPESFFRRASQVSPLASGERQGSVISYLGSNALKVAGMFGHKGDSNPRSNLPGRPVFDKFAFAGFLVGLGLSAWRIRKAEYAFLLFWLGTMLLPTALSEYAPHFIRGIGAIPPVVILAALGLSASTEWGWKTAARFGRLSQVVVRLALTLVLAGGLFSSAWSTWRAYFEKWAADPGLYYAYDQDLWDLGQYLATLPAWMDLYLSPDNSESDLWDLEEYLSEVPAEAHLYVSPESGEHPTLRFSLASRGRFPAISYYNGRHCQLLPPKDGRPSSYTLLLRSDWLSLPRLEEAFPEGKVVSQGIDLFGKTSYVVYDIPPRSWAKIEPGHSLNYQLGEGFHLVGYDLPPSPVRAGEVLTLTLYWQVSRPTSVDYTVFTHLVGQPGPSGAVPMWGQLDGQPCNASYPTSVWQMGDYLLDYYPISVAKDTPPGEYQLEVGMYNRATMERLPVYGSAGREPEDRILLGPVAIAP